MKEISVNFDEKRKSQMGIKSVGSIIKQGNLTSAYDIAKAVKGPKEMDCLERPWLRGDLSLFLGAPGIGKTSTMLWIFKHILLNNPDGCVVMVSLEMTAGEIIEKWLLATKDCPEISDRFYIVENYNKDGTSKALTATLIKHELRKIKETLNTTIIATFIDHLHQVNINGAVDYNPVVDLFKTLAVEIDTHVFLASQTTKGKAGKGDTPISRDGAFGTSKAEWLSTNIITIFQPLIRVQKETDLPILAFAYQKIRYKNKKDKLKEGMNYLLYFEHESQNLRELKRQEKADFGMYYEKVLELMQNEEKFKSYQFDLSETIVGRDGKEVRLDKIIGGSKPNSEDL
jgi:hypothetical protein